MDRTKITELIRQDILSVDFDDMVYKYSEGSELIYTGLCGYEENSVIVYHAGVVKNNGKPELVKTEGQATYEAYIISSHGTAVLLPKNNWNKYSNSRIHTGIKYVSGISRLHEDYNEILKEKGFNPYFHDAMYKVWVPDTVTELACLVMAGEYLHFLESLSKNDEYEAFKWITSELNMISSSGNLIYHRDHDISLPGHERESESFVWLHSGLTGIIEEVYTSFFKYIEMDHFTFSRLIEPIESDSNKTAAFESIKQLRVKGATKNEIFELLDPDTYYDSYTSNGYLFTINHMVDSEGVKRTLSFLRQQNMDFVSTTSCWEDCMEMCAQMDIDMPFFPENILSEHDHLVELQNLLDNTDTGNIETGIQDIYEKMQEYSYSKNGYTIRPVRDLNELAAESRELHHCVRSYGTRIVSKMSYIFLLRKDDNKESPLYTIELSGHKERIRQIKGKFNSLLTKDDRDPIRDTVNSWCEEFGFTSAE